MKYFSYNLIKNITIKVSKQEKESYYLYPNYIFQAHWKKGDMNATDPPTGKLFWTKTVFLPT